MVNFQLNLAKDPTGIRVYANYQSLNVPVFLQRVVIEELDASGHVIFQSSTDILQYFGTGSGGNYLFTHTPSASPRTIRAKGFYIEIDKVAGSNNVTLP